MNARSSLCVCNSVYLSLLNSCILLIVVAVLVFRVSVFIFSRKCACLLGV